MKCIYAIPPNESGVAQKLVGQYTDSLVRLSEDVIALGDYLRDFAETHSPALLKVDNEDWETVTEDLAHLGIYRLVGELFWSPDDALAVLGGLINRAECTPQSALAHWLGSQGQRHRSFLLLSS